MRRRGSVEAVSSENERDRKGNGEVGGVPGSKVSCYGVEDGEVGEEQRRNYSKQAKADQSEDH